MKINYNIIIKINSKCNKTFYLVKQITKCKFIINKSDNQLYKYYYAIERENINTKKILIDVLYSVKKEKYFPSNMLEKILVIVEINTDIDIIRKQYTYYELKKMVQSINKIKDNYVL